MLNLVIWSKAIEKGHSLSNSKTLINQILSKNNSSYIFIYKNQVTEPFEIK